ncbi:hypothetical protein V5799_025314 [Amblyomma americanum]|uniref:Uncharacterized protein n=1 Tax=Amblyomma americanum TaxID=6943 RepID=A0AAQ4EA20_AMBAM
MYKQQTEEYKRRQAERLMMATERETVEGDKRQETAEEESERPSPRMTLSPWKKSRPGLLGAMTISAVRTRPSGPITPSVIPRHRQAIARHRQAIPRPKAGPLRWAGGRPPQPMAHSSGCRP